MLTKSFVEKQAENTSSVQNQYKSISRAKPAVKNHAVRAIQLSKLTEMVLTDPDSVSREEFMQLQKAVGLRQALKFMEEGRRRKQLKKLGLAETEMKNHIAKNSKQSLSKIKAEAVQNADSVSLADENREKTIQLKKYDGKHLDSTKGKESIPDNLSSGLEKLSGIDLSDVKVHQNSDKPQQVGALAYTQGNDIHIAPGQEKHLPHEGWHVVQQKQGRVKPTLQMKSGEKINDDEALEKEADIMGSKASTLSTQSSGLQRQKSSQTNKESVIQKRNIFDSVFHAIRGKTEDIKKIAEIKKKAEISKTVAKAAKIAAEAVSKAIEDAKKRTTQLTFTKRNDLKNLELPDWEKKNVLAKDGTGKIVGIYPYYVMTGSKAPYKSDGGITIGYGHYIDRSKLKDSKESALLYQFVPKNAVISGYSSGDFLANKVPNSSYVPIDTINRLLDDDIKINVDAINDYFIKGNNSKNKKISLTQNKFDALVVYRYCTGHLGDKITDLLLSGNMNASDWTSAWSVDLQRNAYCQNLFFSN